MTAKPTTTHNAYHRRCWILLCWPMWRMAKRRGYPGGYWAKAVGLSLN